MLRRTPKRTLTACGAALVCVWALALPAAAQDEETPDEEFLQPGFYLAMLAQFNAPIGSSGDFGVVRSVGSDNGWGAGGRFGYRFLPFLSAEVAGDWQDVSNGSGKIAANGMPVDGKFQQWNVGGNLKGYLPFGRFQPYLLAGGAYAEQTWKNRNFALGFEETNTGAIAKVGLGLDAYVNPDLAFTVEGDYVIPTGDLDGTDYFLLNFGFTLRFYGVD